MLILNTYRPKSRDFASLLRKLKAPRREVMALCGTGMSIDNIARQTGFWRPALKNGSSQQLDNNQEYNVGSRER
jgi:hypothetical protein